MQLASAYSSLTENKDDLCCPDLSLTQRLIGFGICCTIGFVIEVLSFGSFFGLFSKDPSKFAILFTLGNIFRLLGTFFIVGPKKQCKNMTEKDRLFTTIIFLAAMGMTLFSVFFWKYWLPTLIFVIIQFIAYVYYILSYIPFGKKMCSMCCKKLCCSSEESII